MRSRNTFVSKTHMSWYILLAHLKRRCAAVFVRGTFAPLQSFRYWFLSRSLGALEIITLGSLGPMGPLCPLCPFFLSTPGTKQNRTRHRQTTRARQQTKQNKQNKQNAHKQTNQSTTRATQPLLTRWKRCCGGPARGCSGTKPIYQLVDQPSKLCDDWLSTNRLKLRDPERNE